MVTNYPQRLAASAGIDAQTAETLTNRALGRLGQFLCGLRGHDSILHLLV